MTQSAYGTLVVGVDGSAGSLAALRWSAARARLLRAEVVAVHAWSPTAPLRAPYASVAGSPTAVQDRRRAARILDESVARLREAVPGAQIREVLAEGPPASVLLRHARGAMLLALGRREHGDAGQPVLGPVARECLRHAHCPVVTVPLSMVLLPRHAPRAARITSCTGQARPVNGGRLIHAGE